MTNSPREEYNSPRGAKTLVVCVLALALTGPTLAADPTAAPDVERLVAALLGDTPMIDDLQHLTDVIGGRPTGSEANLASVEWALKRFRDAGVSTTKESFMLPARWLENSASAEISGDVSFPFRIAAMPYSTSTPPAGLSAPLLDGGLGTAKDFARLGEDALGAFLLIDTPELTDVPGLFREYTDASAIERRAVEADIAGLVYVGSRPKNLLYRHNVARGPDNDRPMVVVERLAGLRALRLLREGHALELRVKLDLETGGTFESWNVIGEIRGNELPDEVVVIGAHLDSWGLGTGALDNGCNVSMLIDLARQIKRLGLQPRRTIRFALFNGEEHGLHGSWGYTRTHADELDRHVMASSYDIGSGRINGFFTNGRPELLAKVDAALQPVRGLGPFENLDVPILGTDNFDFLLEGVANLVANQDSANYGPNYHAASDTFDKVDQGQLRLNATIAAAVTWAFAEMDVDWERQSRDEIQKIIDTTDLAAEMRTFWIMDSWKAGLRGRAKD